MTFQTLYFSYNQNCKLSSNRDLTKNINNLILFVELLNLQISYNTICHVS